MGWGRNDVETTLSEKIDKTKVYAGQKTCGSGLPKTVTGVRISQFGPLSVGKKAPAEGTGRWKNPVRWMGYWRNNSCRGLPVLIIHFYDVPYTNQGLYFPKMADWINELSESDLQYVSHAEIPLGDIWFGDSYIPEGSVAVREVPARPREVTTDTDYYVLHDAIRVVEVGPNNDIRLVKPADAEEWIGSGRVEGPLSMIHVQSSTGDVLATQEGDHERVVKMGFVPDDQGIFHTPPDEGTNLDTFLGGNFRLLVTGKKQPPLSDLLHFKLKERIRNQVEAYMATRSEEVRKRPQVLFPGLNRGTPNRAKRILANYYRGSAVDWRGYMNDKPDEKFKLVAKALDFLKPQDALPDRGMPGRLDNPSVNELLWDLVLGTKDWFHLTQAERNLRFRYLKEEVREMRNRRRIGMTRNQTQQVHPGPAGGFSESGLVGMAPFLGLDIRPKATPSSTGQSISQPPNPIIQSNQAPKLGISDRTTNTPKPDWKKNFFPLLSTMNWGTGPPILPDPATSNNPPDQPNNGLNKNYNSPLRGNLPPVPQWSQNQPPGPSHYQQPGEFAIQLNRNSNGLYNTMPNNGQQNRNLGSFSANPISSLPGPQGLREPSPNSGPRALPYTDTPTKRVWSESKRHWTPSQYKNVGGWKDRLFEDDFIIGSGEGGSGGGGGGGDSGGDTQNGAMEEEKERESR
ncbi:hypothetical protein H072_4248 [Dactylellina haptotyla CBS 200.50]|uniref:Uncharacterized protein n=1 Tax=Dactylellina haptotyla (strain CBS 200.50) TaxID=1284197 RepID=S8BQQ5_DACHA|nr:hypothetical protein H072_4248 [Dactylellina haptotyla CBS 200.50]